MRFLMFLAAALVAAIYTTPVQAGYTVEDLVGQTVITRGTTDPDITSLDFEALEGEFSIYVVSPAPQSSTAATSAIVRLDDVEIAVPDDFHKSGTSLSFSFDSAGPHELEVEIRGQPGSTVAVRVEQVVEADPVDATWGVGTTPLSVWSGHGAGVIGSKMYIVGSQQSGTAMHVYDLVTKTWSVGPSLPIATVHAGVTVLDGKLHVIGGQNPALHATYRSGHYVFDPAAGTWSTRASLPVATTHAPAVALDGKIFFLGGQIGPAGTPNQVATVHVYDPTTDSWALGAPLPSPREWVHAGAIEGRIVVAGGYRGPFFNRLPPLADADIYDPATGAWSSTTPLPEGLQGAAFCTSGPYLVLVGAYRTATNDNWTAKTWVFDSRDESWSRGDDSPVTRFYASAAEYDGDIHVVGGEPSLRRLDILSHD